MAWQREVGRGLSEDGGERGEYATLTLGRRIQTDEWNAIVRRMKYIRWTEEWNKIAEWNGRKGIDGKECKRGGQGGRRRCGGEGALCSISISQRDVVHIQ